MKKHLLTVLLVLCWVVGFAQAPNVMILAADDQTWANEVKSKLQATGLLGTIDVVDARSVTPTVAQMQTYKAILTWSDYSYGNGTTLGNNLASYVDGGGGLVVAVFANASIPLSGNINTATYQVLVPAGQTQGTMLTMGTVLLPSHPIMLGVTSFNGGTSTYKSTSTTLTSGSYRIANYSNGDPLIMAKDNVGPMNAKRVDLNFFPPSTDSRSDFWQASTSGARIMANALLYVGGGATALHFNGWGNTNPGGSNIGLSTYDYITVPDNGTMDLGNTYTIESWVYLDDNQNNTIIDKGSYRYLFQTHPNGQSGLGLYNLSMGWIYSAGTVPTNQWAHVAVTFNANTGTVIFYLNGNVLSTHTSGVSTPGPDNGIITIGRQDPAGCQCNNFDGRMDELRVWNRALPQCEIKNNMNCELNPSGQTGLAALYRFNQGAVNTNNTAITTAIDASGNGNNGTLVNFALTGTTSNWAVGTVGGNCSAFVPLSVTASNNGPLNPGSTLNLSATANGSGASTATYAWTGPNSFTSGTQNPSLSNFQSVNAGTYNVVATSNGCSSSQATTTVVGNIPAGGLDFDGINDAVFANDVNPIDFTSTYTIEAMINVKGYQYGTIVAKFEDDNNNRGYMINLGETGDPTKLCVVHSRLGTWTNPIQWNTGFTPALNTWYHIAVTFDATLSSNNIKLYINGTLQAQTTWAFTLTPNVSRLYIGGYDGPGNGVNAGANSRFFKGAIDDVRMFNRPLCQDEIAATMNCQLTGTEPGLVAYYKFNHGFVNANNAGITTLTDVFSNNGTLTNFALNGTSSNWVAGNVSGTCAAYNAPEINIKGNGNSIVDGDNTPSATDATDFGGTLPSVAVTKTYTIENTGAATLDITSINMTGANASNFTVGGITLPTTIAPSSSATFTVTFNASAIGIKNAAVEISNSDCDEALYNYAVQGEINCSPASFTVCPSNITTTADTGLCSAMVNYVTTIAPGTPAANVTYTFTGATTGSGNGTGTTSTFNVGVTTVTITAANPCSNVTCSFTVTVTDNEKPKIASCPGNIAKNVAAGQCGNNVTWVLPPLPPTVDQSLTSLNIGTVGTDQWQSFTAGMNGLLTQIDLWHNGIQATDFTLTVYSGVGTSGTVLYTGTYNYGTVGSIWLTAAIPTGSQPTMVSGNNYTFRIQGNGLGFNATYSTYGSYYSNSYGLNPCWSGGCWKIDFKTYVSVPGASPTATDNCGISTFSSTHNPGDFFSVGTTPVTYTATDIHGNTSTCSFNVTVTDNENPVITAPANISVNNDAGNCGAVVTYTAPVGTDNCPGATTAQTAGLPSGSTFPIGTTTNTFVVTDANNNTATASFTVTVTDNENPVITAPSNISVNNDANTCGAVVTYTTPVGTDNCPGATTAQTAGLPSGSTFPVGTTINTFVVTDANNNMATASFSVTVTDNQAPVLAGVPANATVSCDNVPAPASVTASDNCSSTLPVSYSQIITSGALPPSGLKGYWNFNENSGTSTADQTSNGNNGTLTSGVNWVSGQSGSAVQFPGTSNSYVNIPNTTSGALDTRYSISMFAWYWPGSNGSQQNPIIQYNANGWGTHLWQTGSNQLFVRFTARGTLAFTNSLQANTLIPNQWNCVGATYDYNTGIARLWCNGVNVQTLNIGVMQLSTNYPVRVGSVDFDSRRTNSKVDNVAIYDRALNATEIAQLCAVTCPQNYTITRTWSATDAANNTTTASQTITVKDTTAPVLTVPAPVAINNATGTCGAVANFLATATDNCSNNLTITYSQNPGTVFPVGTTTVNVTAKDECGNTTTGSFTVTVTDNENPVITAPANIAVNNDEGICGAVVTFTAPVGTDNCPGATTVQTAGLSSGSTFPVGTTTNTFVVTDAYNNTATASFTVTVTDNESPVIIAPANIAINNDAGICGAVVTYAAPVGTDNCPGATTAQTAGLPSGFTFPVGTTTNTFVVTDAYNHTTTASFTVTVTDNERPVITAPSNISVNNNTGICGAAVTYSTPVGTDNCPGSTTAQTAGLPSGSTFPVGTTTNTFVVTDAHGNTATASFTVTVTDNERPNAVCQNYTLNLSGGTGTITPANINNGSTDNCGIASMSLSKTSFNCTNAGANSVTLTVTDIHGNSSTCTATVTVQYRPTCTIAVTPSNTTYTGGVATNIYLGYGPQSATATCNATGGTGFTYSWSPSANLSCTNCQSPVFTPTTPGNYTYTVTATNSNGCATTCTVTFCVLDVRVPGQNNKVYLCHVPPGNPGNSNTLSISVNAVPAHLTGHSGDRLGTCSQVICGSPKGTETAGPGIIHSDEFKIYPNPTSGVFKVEIPHDVKVDKIVVMDITGKVVATKTNVEGNTTFELGDVARGVYMVNIMYGTEVYRTKLTVQ